jgi:DNA-binding beta-propeller fold protein YncE
MGAGDFWSYNVINDLTARPNGTTARKVVSDDGAGHVALEDDDGGASITPYTVTADGLLNTQPLGDVPPSAKSIAGAIFDYATPLYPVGAVRRHVRSGPWGEDLDGDGIGESFRFEYTQVFLGFETMQLSAAVTLNGVAHFRNVVHFAVRLTRAGDASLVATEEAWFAPGLGLVRAQRVIVDGSGVLLDSPHTLMFDHGLVGGAVWDLSDPPPVLGGSFVDVPLTHNALVYDGARNVYYASVPGSVPNNGNRIATIDPATGQISFSGTVGSEPDALAISADASSLYVGLDGTSELVKLALPAMTELGRVNIGSPFFAETVAASPVDPDAVAVSRKTTNSIPGHAGVVLFRSLVAQPKTLTGGGNLIVFDAAGTTLYGMDTESSMATLLRTQVLADGLVQDLAVGGGAFSIVRALTFAANRVIAGHTVYNAPALTAAGVAPSQGDCRPQRSANRLLCLSAAEGGGGQPRILVVDGDTFVIKALPLYAGSESASPRRLVEGPAGQVAISYQANSSGFVSKIRLFSSTDLLAPSALAPPSWLVTTSTTRDGSALSIGITHRALVFDGGRNVYYASIPGSVAGFGNSIATIDPSSGQIAYSAPIGSEPNALAIAADGSALYVGLDGSGEVVNLALPSMSEQGRTRLAVDPFLGHANALALAVSPVNSSVAAVSMTPGVAGAATALLRGMVTQPNVVLGSGSDQILFDSAGTTLYGLNDDNAIVDQWQLLPDGLTLQKELRLSFLFKMDALSFANNRIIVGQTVLDAPALSVAGTIPNSYNCWAARAGTGLLCLAAGGLAQGTMLLADAATLTAGNPLLYALFEPAPPARLLQGPPGQVAFDYSGLLGPPSILLFTSPQLP